MSLSFFFCSLRAGSVTHRRATEIQLDTLLKEKESFLPYFIRQATDSLSPDEVLSVEEISKMLNTQNFIIERLICVLSGATCNDSLPPLNRNVIQKLTRVLTSTIDVRCLLFFKMLDKDRDQHVGREEVSSFYETYLNNMESFNKSIIPHVICVIIKKFHLDTVSLSNCRSSEIENCSFCYLVRWSESILRSSIQL